MDRKPVSDPGSAALGRFQGKIDHSFDFRQGAFGHNLGRNIRAAKLLGYLALSRQEGASLTGSIECLAATRQNFSSSQSMTHMGMPTGPRQAAHFLPGQIWVGGREVWHLATKPKARAQMEFLFAEVEHLAVTFNQADSAAEDNASGGLCAALANACTAIFRQAIPSEIRAGKLPLSLMQLAYGEWHSRALTALNTAIAAKTAKPGIPPLLGNSFDGYTSESIAARCNASATQWNRDDSLRILQYYFEDQQQRTWQWVIGSCQGALQEVESGFAE